MNTYLISPEDCLVVRAIHRSDSLRSAATLLNCDAGGLFRKVKRIADDHDLLCKLDGKWGLTPKGLNLLAWTEETMQSQRAVVESRRQFRIATTTWFSEQALIPHLKKIQDSISDLGQIKIEVPYETFEQSLKNGAVDFVIVCHAPFDPSIAYKKICAEEWVTVAPISYQKGIVGKSPKTLANYLENKPFVYHNALNPHSLLSFELKRAPTLVIDHLVGVRAAVVNGLGWSVVPRILVSSALKAKEVIQIHEFKPAIENQVCIWWLRDRSDLKKLIPVFDQALKSL